MRLPSKQEIKIFIRARFPAGSVFTCEDVYASELDPGDTTLYAVLECMVGAGELEQLSDGHSHLDMRYRRTAALPLYELERNDCCVMQQGQRERWVVQYHDHCITVLQDEEYGTKVSHASSRVVWRAPKPVKLPELFHPGIKAELPRPVFRIATRPHHRWKRQRRKQ